MPLPWLLPQARPPRVPSRGRPSPHRASLTQVSCRPALILSCAAPSVRTRSPSAPHRRAVSPRGPSCSHTRPESLQLGRCISTVLHALLMPPARLPFLPSLGELVSFLLTFHRPPTPTVLLQGPHTRGRDLPMRSPHLASCLLPCRHGGLGCCVGRQHQRRKSKLAALRAVRPRGDAGPGRALPSFQQVGRARAPHQPPACLCVISVHGDPEEAWGSGRHCSAQEITAVRGDARVLASSCLGPAMVSARHLCLGESVGWGGRRAETPSRGS